MSKGYLDCVINIYHDEIINIIPIIGNICDSIEIKLNIIKLKISNRYNKYSTNINWDNINEICKKYKSLLFNPKNNSIIMPEFADIYFTTEYTPSHTIQRQYMKYVLLYYDIKQLTWTDKNNNKVESNNIRWFFQFDVIIQLKETIPSLRESIIKYYPKIFSDKINNFFNIYSFGPDRKCMENILNIDPNKTIFNKIYTFGLWIDTRIMHKKGVKNELSFSGDGSDVGVSDTIIASLSKFITDNNVTQIIDLSCGDMKWMSILLDKNKQITDYHGNDVSLNAIKIAQTNIKKRDNLNITFSTCNTSHELFAKKLKHIMKGTSLIISRLTMQHMTNEEIINTIKNLIKYVNFTYIGLSSIKTILQIRDEWIIQQGLNRNDINRGGYRGINLDEYPFDDCLPFAIMDDQTHIIGKNKHKELIDIYFYTNKEFSKLRDIKKRYIKHNFISYMQGGVSVIDKKIYKFYEIKNIDELLNKKDNYEIIDNKKKWYTLKI